MALFGECGYRGVWAGLVAAPGMPDVDPSAAALRQARRRLGSAPLSALFDEVKGTAAAEDATGSWWKGLRTVAWDSTGILVADSEANRSYCGRPSGRNGVCGFPMIRLSRTGRVRDPGPGRRGARAVDPGRGVPVHDAVPGAETRDDAAG
ncbi:transposase domain-containing protein [Streptomyces umbrinus]